MPLSHASGDYVLVVQKVSVPRLITSASPPLSNPDGIPTQPVDLLQMWPTVSVYGRELDPLLHCLTRIDTYTDGGVQNAMEEVICPSSYFKGLMKCTRGPWG
jgi:hypothetical protein